jgi:aminoglycoside phosphotransferase (APT) family kinase protein
VTETAETTEGIDGERVGAWLEANVAGATGPFRYERIAGGRSNLTYAVTGTRGGKWALRRPPLGKALGSAHDMGREHRVVSALAPTPVPVAPIAGYCTDESVNGAPFYVMEFIEGPILRLREDAEAFDESGRRAIGERVVDTLVEIHAQVPNEIGLGELGKREDYVARQLRRWAKQWEGSKTREIPLVERVHERLAERIPEQGPATLVHGDYRLANRILPPRDEVRARYAARSGRDLAEIDFFVALGYWKLAVILEGVYSRYAKGQYGKPESGFEEFGKNVARLAEAADEAVDRLG